MSADVIYLDNNATTRLRPRVLEAMLPYLTEQYGNPASIHHFGAQIGARIEEAREKVAAAIGARTSEIIFTSGGTESDNTALRGVTAARPNRKRVVISAVEHHAILEPAEALAREGFDVVRVPIDGDGRLDLEQLAAAADQRTVLVSVMLSNNETGVIHPVQAAAEIAHRCGAAFHTDAVNALGKTAIDVESLGVDLLSLSAHKIHGPKGCGALYVRRGTAIRPLLLGGAQERQRRGGTSNVAGIIGLAAACEAIDLPEMERVAALRDRLERDLAAHAPDMRIIGAPNSRVPNTSCVCFPGVMSEAVLLLLSEAGICASAGAACSSGSLEPSHVLAAMGVDAHIAQGQIRLSLSRETTSDEIDRVVELLPPIVRRVAGVRA
ncbi:MAG: aminotransferase class V-fold PLP-dependent enzyme [Planctomycetes bacterium]|nr:aminotransferase class V-fold PLP-dependent enzyme [Planctomycetota bacterium]